MKHPKRLEYRLKKSAPGWAKVLDGVRGQRHKWKPYWRRYKRERDATQALRVLGRKNTLFDFRMAS